VAGFWWGKGSEVCKLVERERGREEPSRPESRRKSISEARPELRLRWEWKERGWDRAKDMEALPCIQIELQAQTAFSSLVLQTYREIDLAD